VIAWKVVKLFIAGSDNTLNVFMLRTYILRVIDDLLENSNSGNKINARI
jgi:hypothetical protein